MVDIAVPRDLDPRIGDLPNVFLYDIDDLQGIVEANLAERKRAAEEIGLMIEQEIVVFKEWVATTWSCPSYFGTSSKSTSYPNGNDGEY